MKKILKKDNAITLVALIITIIILLILAGITISQLANNGLFDKSKIAKEKYENSEANENDKIAKYENEIDSYVSGNRDTVTISTEEYNRLLKSSNANNYTTGEQVIGTWTDGKPIYQKTFNTSISISNGSGPYSTSINALLTDAKPLKASAVGKINGTDSCGDVFIWTKGNTWVLYSVNNMDVSSITIQYTKTTD